MCFLKILMKFYSLRSMFSQLCDATKIVMVSICMINFYIFIPILLVQSFYEKKGVNLKLIAIQMVSTVSSTETCAL